MKSEIGSWDDTTFAAVSETTRSASAPAPRQQKTLGDIGSLVSLAEKMPR